MHLLGARETAEKHYMELSPEVRAVCEAYAAGLNYYVSKPIEPPELVSSICRNTW